MLKMVPSNVSKFPLSRKRNTERENIDDSCLFTCILFLCSGYEFLEEPLHYFNFLNKIKPSLEQLRVSLSAVFCVSAVF